MDGRICAQRFHAFWLNEGGPPLEMVAAVLNGPIANAYLAAHQRDRDNHIIKLEKIPIPLLNDEDWQEVVTLVNDYSLLAGKGALKSQPRDLSDTLLKIDGIILRGYDLPASLERQIFDFFAGAERPVPFDFSGYDLQSFMPSRMLPGVSDPELAWDAFNERRAYLIDKELAEGLDGKEESELKSLQAVADRYLDTISPVQLEDLDWLAERIRNA